MRLSNRTATKQVGTLGAPTRVRFFVTMEGAWKHNDLPAPVGATKKTSRFERMAFNASSWVDEWLQEWGLWFDSVSFKWRKSNLSFSSFRGFVLNECMTACHMHHVYHWHSWIPSESTYCGWSISPMPTPNPPQPVKNILGYPVACVIQFLCCSAFHKLLLVGSEGGDPKNLCTHLQMWWGEREACSAAKRLWKGEGHFNTHSK